MLGRHETWKYLQATGFYCEIVIATAKRLASILHNAQSPAFRAVIGKEFFQSQDAMSDAV